MIAQKRDHKAFEQLYDVYSGKLLRFCKRMVWSSALAEDIVHEVFLRVIENPHAFQVTQKFSTWVYTIAHRLCLNQLRNAQHRHQLLNEEYGEPESVNMHLQHDAVLLRQKINELYVQLSEKEQAIFVLRFEHKLSIKEIADILDIPEGSVKSGVFYLLKKFDAHLIDFIP